jgi:hypothetical protein
MAAAADRTAGKYTRTNNLQVRINRKARVTRATCLLSSPYHTLRQWAHLTLLRTPIVSHYTVTGRLRISAPLPKSEWGNKK